MGPSACRVRVTVRVRVRARLTLAARSASQPHPHPELQASPASAPGARAPTPRPRSSTLCAGSHSHHLCAASGHAPSPSSCSGCGSTLTTTRICALHTCRHVVGIGQGAQVWRQGLQERSGRVDGPLREASAPIQRQHCGSTKEAGTAKCGLAGQVAGQRSQAGGSVRLRQRRKGLRSR